MTVRTTNHHSIGHSLYSIGSLLVIIGCMIIGPLSLASTQALGALPIVELTNNTRNILGKPELQINTSLMNAAQAKAEHMVKNRYFAHFAKDGTSPWDFMSKTSYDYSVAGENLAITNENDDAVIKGWLQSPTHRENMLSTKYQHIGIGVASYGDYEGNANTTVVVAMYGSLRQGETNTSVAGSAYPKSTNPAGALTILGSSGLSGNLGNYIGVFGLALLVSGIALEMKHLKAHHLVASRV